MAIIYSYPKVTTPLATDVLVLTDTTLTAGKRKNKTKSLALSDLASYVISSTSAITGGGTFNTIPLWTPDGFKLGDSIITQAASGQAVTITGQLDVTEDFNVTGSTGLFGSLTVEEVATFNDEVECNNNVTVQGIFAADGNSVFSGSLTIDERLIDGTGSSGTAGQVLSSTGTGVEWINSTNANTTYDLNGAVSNTNEFAIALSGSDGTLDKVNLIPGTNITLTDNGSNGVTIDSSASVLAAESIVQPIIADGALVKGDPVYITGFNNGQNKNIVAKADSSDPAKMPVVGISDGAYADNGAGFMTAFGSFNGTFDTTGGAENWSVGDIIYVKPGGGLTNIKPGGTDLVQNIAIVSRVQQNTGELEVIALGRTNDVPNLPTGRLFVGTAANTSLASDVIYVDDTNDRVGVGLTNPLVPLDVAGKIRSTDDNSSDYLEMFVDSLGGGDSYIKTSNFDLYLVPETGKLLIQGDPFGPGANGSVEVYDANNIAVKVKLDSSGDSYLNGGNVGIGTTSPAGNLHVVGASGNSGRIYLSDKDDGVGGGDALLLTKTGVNSYIYNRDSGDLRLGTNDQFSYVTIKPTGNVGIGTTSPATKLHVSGGDIRVDDTERIEFGAGGVRINNDASGRMYYNAPLGYYWQAGSGYKMVLLDSGNVGIGTTSPASKLEVDGGDIEVDDSASGLILRSPDGTRYRVTVANGGTLSVAAV